MVIGYKKRGEEKIRRSTIHDGLSIVCVATAMYGSLARRHL